MKKKETRVLCPECGTEFQVADKDAAAVAVKIGKGSSAEIIYPAVAEPEAQVKAPKLPVKAQERIDALQNAGVDVSHLFAMHGDNGDDYVVSKKNGDIMILGDDDPLFHYLLEQGTVPNRRLFRRWIMAQMFRMLTYKSYRQPGEVGVTPAIRDLGYEYQWNMLMDELRAQMKMADRDPENFTRRNRWFNKGVAAEMAKDYIEKLKRYVCALPDRHCKRIPYKRIVGHDIFVQDLHAKLYVPLTLAMSRIRMANNAVQLYWAVEKFNKLRIKMRQHIHPNIPQSKAWVDAYKGAGAYFTMQNLIRFHDCVAYDDNGKRLDKFQSLAFIEAKAEAYKDGEGWRLLAAMKKLLDDNNINVKKKMAEWRKKKKK